MLWSQEGGAYSLVGETVICPGNSDQVLQSLQAPRAQRMTREDRIVLQTARVQGLPLPFNSYVTLGRINLVTVTQLFSLLNGANNSTHHRGLLWGPKWKEIIHIKQLEQCLTHSKLLISVSCYFYFSHSCGLRIPKIFHRRGRSGWFLSTFISDVFQGLTLSQAQELAVGG